MKTAVEGVIGFVLGSVIGLGTLLTGCIGLWATRDMWFERPDGDSLQHFDLMVWLVFGAAALALPVGLASGLVGAWLASRDWPPSWWPRGAARFG